MLRRLLVAAPWQVFVGLLALSSPTASSAEGSNQLRVICPAIDLDERQRQINAPSELNVGPIKLVVLGVAKRHKPSEPHNAECDLAVEKVFYGSTSEKTLHLSGYFYPPEGKRNIFAIMPDAYNRMADYEARYYVDAKEEKAQMALARARLDYHALAADAIFVGKETAIDEGDDNKRTIEVVRVLYGSDPKAGEKAVMEVVDHVHRAGKAASLGREPMIYFVRIKHELSGEKVFQVDTRLPVACEAEVTAALKRRDAYPIVELKERGKLVRAREVTFRGDLDDAIEFLGSERFGAVDLAVRAFMRQKEAAREKLPAAIQREMFRDAPPAWGEFRKLQNLIRLLGRMGGGSSGGPLCRLLEKELDYIAARPAKPAAPKRSAEAAYENPADDDSVNHALAWLAVAIDEQVLLQQYGSRLTKLRDAAQGYWKAELQLALDVAHVEDNLELISLPDGKLMRSQPRIYHSGGVQGVAFSADGSLLATGGKWGTIRIWKTGDWSLARVIELEGQICDLAFSQEGGFLSATSADGAELIGHRFEWRTGTAVPSPVGQELKDTRYLKASSRGHRMESIAYPPNAITLTGILSDSGLRAQLEFAKSWPRSIFRAHGRILWR